VGSAKKEACEGGPRNGRTHAEDAVAERGGGLKPRSPWALEKRGPGGGERSKNRPCRRKGGEMRRGLPFGKGAKTTFRASNPESAFTPTLFKAYLLGGFTGARRRPRQAGTSCR